MAIKAAMFQNWMLTTNLSRFPASFKYCLFPQRIYLALDALSLSIFWKSAVISYFKRDCQQILLHSFPGGRKAKGSLTVFWKFIRSANLTRAVFDKGPCLTKSAFLWSYKLWFIKILNPHINWHDDMKIQYKVQSFIWWIQASLKYTTTSTRAKILLEQYLIKALVWQSQLFFEAINCDS